MIINPYIFGGGIDPDAQAFITAASITDATQKTAINNLVVSLKGYGIWTKMKAIYPFVGGTASTHKFNLKDPRDLDAAFRLVFNGGWTHSSTGATPNGTNGYADTKFTPSTFYSVNTPHLSVYSRTDTIGGDKQEIGSVSSPGTAPEASLLIKYTSNIAYPILGGIQFPSISNTDSRGFYIANRKNTTNIELFKNNSKIINSAQFYNTSNVSIYIGARNNNNTGAQRYSDRQLAFSSIGDGLSDTEAANFYTAVQAFQVTLNRQIP